MRLLLFDIDGTLISAHGAGRRALERALERCYGFHDGLQRIPLDGKTDPLIVREALSARGLPFGGLSPQFLSVYIGYLREELERCRDFAVLRGVAELMAELAPDNRLGLGIATGNVEAGAQLKMARAGLSHYFGFGGYGCDAEDRTEVIRAAVRRGRQAAAEPVRDVIVIGDTPRDIEHGRKAGARVMAVATGAYDQDSLRRCQPDLAVASLQPTADVLDFLRAS